MNDWMNQCQDFTRSNIETKNKKQNNYRRKITSMVCLEFKMPMEMRTLSEKLPNDERNEQMIAYGEYTSHGGAHSTNRNRDLPYGICLY